MLFILLCLIGRIHIAKHCVHIYDFVLLRFDAKVGLFLSTEQLKRNLLPWCALDEGWM